MARMEVGKLTLMLNGYPAGYGAEAGERLARKVADRLAAATLAGVGSAGNLRVELAAGAEPNTDELAEQVAAAILRELERSV